MNALRFRRGGAFFVAISTPRAARIVFIRRRTVECLCFARTAQALLECSFNGIALLAILFRVFAARKRQARTLRDRRLPHI